MYGAGGDGSRLWGPIEHRPGHLNVVRDYWTDGGLGIAELLQMADDDGALPLVVVTAGCSTCTDSCISASDTDLKALDALDYAIGPVTSTWGARRAASGRT